MQPKSGMGLRKIGEFVTGFYKSVLITETDGHSSNDVAYLKYSGTYFGLHRRIFTHNLSLNYAQILTLSYSIHAYQVVLIKWYIKPEQCLTDAYVELDWPSILLGRVSERNSQLLKKVGYHCHFPSQYSQVFFSFQMLSRKYFSSSNAVS